MWRDKIYAALRRTVGRPRNAFCRHDRLLSLPPIDSVVPRGKQESPRDGLGSSSLFCRRTWLSLLARCVISGLVQNAIMSWRTKESLQLIITITIIANQETIILLVANDDCYKRTMTVMTTTNGKWSFWSKKWSYNKISTMMFVYKFQKHLLRFGNIVCLISL